MVDWRAQLYNRDNRERYIRETLGITAAKSSKEYSNVDRYVRLIAQGKRSGASPKYAPVVERATKDALPSRPVATGTAATDEGAGGGGGGYVLNQTISKRVEWTMRYSDGTREDRRVTLTSTLRTENMVNDANSKGVDRVLINDYYSDGAYYDDWDDDEPPDIDWWSDYAETDAA